MEKWIQPYRLVLMLVTVLPAIFIIQTLVGVFFRLKENQIPGMPITTGHSSALFRVDRARGNFIEVLGPFILVIMLGILFKCSPTMLTVSAGLFVAARISHMLSYYAGWELPRVLSFVSGNIATVIGIVAVVLSW
jgi:uncharacterized MAPEG superfamily protein